MRRRFNRREKAALLVVSHGLCEECGNELHQGWHADHIIPFTKNGPTDVANGQALCSFCNQSKGADLVNKFVGWPLNVELRKWQEGFLAALKTRRNEVGLLQDFLLVATPGAGKTIAALRVGHDMILSREVDRVVIVCNSDYLRTQWANVAAAVGMQLNAVWQNSDGPENPDDYCGMVVTYHQVAANKDIHRMLTNRKSTLVILDEIHHAGDGLDWGNAVRYAFENATFRLALSGTPFRSDSNTIPFVTYINGRSRGDFVYGYAEALKDYVNRYVLFPTWEGHMKWISKNGVFDAAFSDELPEEESNRRLLTAISITGEWLPGVLRSANEQLVGIRGNGHSDAGGLVIARDMEHAKGIADLLERISGSPVSIAVSDDPEARQVIKQFAESKRPWIVAVRMVSEGVDIQRLRVLVYATNITTELFFRQAAGRIVRVISQLDADQTAYFYIPRDQRLLEFAQQLKMERDHILQEPEGQEDTNPSDRSGGEGVCQSVFVPISATAEEHDVIAGESSYSAAEVLIAENIRRTTGIPQSIPTVHLLAFAKRYALENGHDANQCETAVITPQTPTKRTDEAKKAIRSRVRAMIGRLYFILKANTQLDQSDFYKLAFMRLTAIDGKQQSGDDVSLADLNRRIDTLSHWIKEASDGRRPFDY